MAEAARPVRDDVLSRFEEIAAVAADLVSAGDVDDVLERITDRVALALPAPRHLLAVRLDDQSPVRVHHRGFDDPADAAAFADLLLDGGATAQPDVIVAEVRSPRRHYGKVAAVFPPGSSDHDEAWPEHQRLMNVYASHAASALEVAAALEGARRDRDAARALLGLARDLAEVVVTTDIAHRVASAATRIMGSDAASVWLWDAATERLTRAVSVSAAGRPLEVPAELTAAVVPALLELARTPKPMIIHADALTAADPVLQDMLAAAGLASAVVAPIAGRGGYIGVITATFRTDIGADANANAAYLVERLEGLAHHAAVAYENADLVERLQHLALHDPLTGVANRPLLKDHLELAQREASRHGRRPALLYIDLDRFKEVNDTLGHGAGDELLLLVARRLERALRPGDTLGRLGGDEFAVVLPGAGDEASAARVGARLREAVAFPFIVAGRRVEIGCCIGAAVALTDHESFESLASRADAAMYAEKAGVAAGCTVVPVG